MEINIIQFADDIAIVKVVAINRRIEKNSKVQYVKSIKVNNNCIEIRRLKSGFPTKQNCIYT